MMRSQVTLDRDLEVRTPEHVGISYRLAGIGNRFLAAFIDVTLLSILEFGLALVLALIARGSDPLVEFAFLGVATILLALVIPFAYWILLEAFWNGQTIGKRVVGIRVIRDDGSPVGFFAVLARGVLRVLDLVIFPVDVIVMLLSSKGQRLGDLVAGTVVVKAGFERDFGGLRTRAEPAGATLTVRGLSGEEQRLVREFMLREATLPVPARRSVAEAIAKRLRPAIPESADHPDDVEFLHAVAASLREAGGESSGSE